MPQIVDNSATSFQLQKRQLIIIVASSAVLWVILILIGAIFKIDRYVGDVPSYWYDSQKLNEFNIYHLPLYPVTLFPLTLLTPSDFNPLGVMSIIAALAWIGGILAAFFLLRQLNAGKAALGAFLFGMYPIVGLGYALYPTSDIIGRLWIVIAVFFYLQGRKWPTVVMLSLALITHKVLWLNVLIIALIGLYQHRLTLIHIIMSGVPLGIYTLLGAVHYGNILWILNDTIGATRFKARDIQTVYPLFDTILGRLANGGLTNILVAGIVIIIVLTAIFLLLSRVWTAQPILLAFILPPLVVSVVMAAASSMVVIRFSPFMLIPLWLYLFPNEQPRWKFLANPITMGAITTICIGSQIFFLFYIQHFYAPFE